MQNNKNITIGKKDLLVDIRERMRERKRKRQRYRKRDRDRESKKDRQTNHQSK